MKFNTFQKLKLLISSVLFYSTIGASIIDNAWHGVDTINEPVLCELIESHAVQRLKKINQYGIDAFVRKPPYTYTRYDHSIGVLLLLKKYNASLKEQIAGLLHDVSHTVFSHVGDHLFTKEHNQHVIHQASSAYQDDMFEWFLAQTDIPAILEKYGFNVSDILPKSGKFLCLEQPLPDLCADRLEYVLHGAFLEKKLIFDQVTFILDSLQFKDNHFIFTNQQAAYLFATSALYLTEQIFGAVWNAVLYQKATALLRMALKNGVVTNDEIHFSTDDVVWDQIAQSNDPLIKVQLDGLYQIDAYEVCDTEAHDMELQAKFRGIDPWVKVEEREVRLTELNNTFKEQYETAKKTILRKRCVRYKDLA